ncbi:MAG: DUF4266 domain-containing protein [Polyangiaceae bacterium]|nr:DUF4266 domain-containing protein [Polyangiaceae bacterium]
MRLLVPVLLVLLSSGCAHVAPYEREHLTDPAMDTSREAMEARFRSHVHDAREGATGGSGSTGGGCGCN